jgi:hypothetical protein
VRDVVAFALVRSFNTGPAGILMMIVGVLLAGSSAYTAFAQSGWPRLLPSILIGLSLIAVGYSLVARERRSRATGESDGADRDEL